MTSRPASWFESWREATLAPFRVRIFAAIWIATLVSTFGSLIQAVGASWLMTSIAPSADMVALVQTSTALPITLLSIVAGALSDIWDRRRLMLVAQTLLLTVSAVLAFVAWRGLVTPWMLLGFTFLIGCGGALYGPAWQSSVGEQVPRELVPQAVALNSLGFNIARTVGPAIGGAIVASFGPPAAFLLNAFTYFALIAVLVSWKRPETVRHLPPESLGTAVMSGLRYARLSPDLVTIFVRGFVFGVLGSSIWALMPLIARDLVQGGAVTYGVLLGAFGGGAVVGALTSAQLRVRYSNEAVVRLGTIAFGVGTCGAGLSSWLWVTMISLFLAGAAWVLVLSTFNTSVQVSSPRWVVGRSISIYQALTFGGLAIGSWLWGVAAHEFGLREVLIDSGLAMLASLLIGHWMRVPQSEVLDLDPSRRDPQVREPKVDIVAQSGPIVLNVEYRIAVEDQMGFLSAIREVARIRRRDGARGWTLQQDMDDPERWIERFHSPTWLAHLRRRLRHTMADQAAEEQLRALHRGSAPPKITRYLERPPGAMQARQKDLAEKLGERAMTTDPMAPSAAGAPRDSPIPRG